MPMYNAMKSDSDEDRSRSPLKKQYPLYVWSQSDMTFEEGLDDMWDNYIVPRRNHFYVTHSITNTAKALGYGTELNAGIPLAQSDISVLKAKFEVVAVPGGAVVRNLNEETVDISGWRLSGAMNFTFPAGSVIDQAFGDAPGEVFVVSNRIAYVASLEAAGVALTDQVILGNAEGGSGIGYALADAQGEPVFAPVSESGLRFHTIYGSTVGDGNTGEFIVLTNVSANAVVLEGVRVSVAKRGKSGVEAPKCLVTLGVGTVPAYGSVRLDQADYSGAGWDKITNGAIFIKIEDADGSEIQSGFASFGLYPECDGEGSALRAKRFDSDSPLQESTDDWEPVAVVSGGAVPVPVIGGAQGAAIVVGEGSVSVTIGNAAAGHRYGYRKSATIAGLKDAPIVYLGEVAVSDGALTLDIPRDENEQCCFYQVVAQ